MWLTISRFYSDFGISVRILTIRKNSFVAGENHLQNAAFRLLLFCMRFDENGALFPQSKRA